MTNLERIKNMDFEEMYEFIMGIQFDEFRHTIRVEGQWMTQTMLEIWLESEVQP